MAEKDTDASFPLLTDLAKETVTSTQTAHEGEGPRQHRTRLKSLFMERLRNARTNPLIVEENITPQLVMDFIRIGANQQTGDPLSDHSYRGMKAAVNHLFRCQNGIGTSAAYNVVIKNLFGGFGKVSVRRTRRGRRSRRNQRDPDQAGIANEQAVAANEESDDSSDDSGDDRDEFKEGKEPMSVELYRSVIKWMLDYASTDSLLAACFICLTWNLACRGNNTAKLKLSHMSWMKFDCMQINFKHTKTDVSGAQKRAKRNLYANVKEPDIDFTFLLGLYLASCFTTSSRQEAGFRLFPGSSEGTAKRVSRKLKEVLELHRDEVMSMGYSSISDIGLHSLRKGAASYLGSLPGGPSPVAICHRCGWSTGKVLDIYFRQLQRGDEFVGRCLSLLNLLSSDFASSPAYFSAELVNDAWMSNCLQQVFPCFYHLERMQKILQQCLASMMHHRDRVCQLEANHPARASIAIFRDHRLMGPGLAALKVDKAWETTNHISGVPPHVKELVDLAEIKDQLETIVDRIFEKVMNGTQRYFEECRIGGGEITEARLMRLIQNASDATRTEVSDRLTNQLERLLGSFQFNQNLNDEPGENSTELLPTELPEDFEFPSSNTLDLWTQWNIPNRERQIPALRNVSTEAYKFLDLQPRSRGECNRLTRLQRTRTDERRASRKVASDMKTVCEFIEKEATQFGYINITEEKMGDAFRKVTESWERAGGLLTNGGRRVRFEQRSWKTTLTFVRKLKKRKNDCSKRSQQWQCSR